jgi:hypothetical protein
MRAPKIIRRILAAALLLIVPAAAAVTWLYATPPKPRASEAWQLGPALPARRGELAMAVAFGEPCAAPPCPLAERLYVLGGLSSLFRPEDRVSVYDPTHKRWSAGPPMPAARHHFAARALGQALYVSGGATVAGVHLGEHYWPPTDTFWRLPAGSERWETAQPMIEPRWGHRMVAHDGRLYVIGGRGPSGRVLIYTPDKGWTTGAEMPRPRDHLSVVVTGGRIWAIGGRDPRSLARVDIYDPAADKWQAGPDLLHPTSGAAEGEIDGVIFIYGGEEPDFIDGGVNDRHWMLDSRASTPRWVAAPAPPLAVHGTDGAVLRGAMVLAGGATWHGAYSVMGWSDALQLMKPGGIRR